MERVTIENNKNSENLFTVNMTITKGKLFALYNSLKEYSIKSNVGKDVYLMLKRELNKFEEFDVLQKERYANAANN